MSSAQQVAVLLPADLVKQIELFEPDRSRFVTEAIERELHRRRREALLQSLARPHPETVASEGQTLDDWDLPVENDLVDLSAGTAVRWIEGQGWVTDANR
jgi:hypothetical protein